MSRKQTVVAVVPLPPPMHGAARVSDVVLSELRAAAPPELLVTVADTGIDRLSRSRIPYHMRRVSAHLLGAIQVLAARARRREVVVYLGGAGGLGLWYQALVVAVAWLTGSGVVWHHHSYRYIDGNRSQAVRIIAHLMRRRGVGIYLSQGMRENFERMYPSPAASEICSNVFTVEQAAQRTEEASVPRLIHVSNMSREKGSLSVLTIYRRLREQGRNTELTLVGPATEEVRAMIETVRREGHPVNDLGPLEPLRVRAELDRAHVFLFPSTNEAEPLVVLEALARGVPVVCTNRGALPEIIPADWLMIDDDTGVRLIHKLLDRPWIELSDRARAVITHMTARSRSPCDVVLSAVSGQVGKAS